MRCDRICLTEFVYKSKLMVSTEVEPGVILLANGGYGANSAEKWEEVS